MADHILGNPADGTAQVGKKIFVRPSTGLDNHAGDSPDRAVKTLSQAITLVDADKNDVVYMVSEDNSASGTTDYQDATLTFNKDGMKLVGVNAGNLFGLRSRIAQTSTATGVSPLVNVTANNCYFEGIHIFHGVDDATSLVALRVSGERNHFKRCHIAGVGNATQDASGGRSLVLDGAAETLFEECVIGLDTIERATAEAEIECDNQVTRVIFKNCIIPTMSGDAGFLFLDAAASGDLDRFLMFDNCTFINATNSTATVMTAAMDVHASAGGHVIVKDCMLIGATDWEAADSTVIQLLGAGSGTAADIREIGIANTLDVAS